MNPTSDPATPVEQPKVSSNGHNANASESERALRALLWVMIAGLLSATIYSAQTSFNNFLGNAAIALMTAGASAFIGGLLGFLFGIPRTLQHDKPTPTTSSGTTPANRERDNNVNYLANTNLEQISDWLTKILVGVTLTKIAVIPGKLNNVSTTIATGLVDMKGGHIFALALIIFFGICGFLFSYLWTRLFLPTAFRQSDDSSRLARLEEKAEVAEQKAQVAEETVVQAVHEVNKKLEEIENQSKLDANALSMVHRQMNPSSDIPPITQEQLSNSLKSASVPARTQIFYTAQGARSQNWKTDKKKMALTIPIFKALIASDPEDKFQHNHSQLGYALKDQENPDLDQAIIELTKAINIRNSRQEKGWVIYEYNRAVARIKNDKEFKSGQESDPNNKALILEDLKAYKQSGLKVEYEDKEVEEWMKLNGIKAKDLH